VSHEFTDKQVQNFIDAWEADFGERLTIEEARSELSRLLHFFLTIARSISSSVCPA
jgi:hypothetical protein